MKNEIQDYIKELSKLLDFSSIGWWIVDYRNSPNHFYCNKLMTKNFNLDETLNKHEISPKFDKLLFDEYKNINHSSFKEHIHIFPYLDDIKKTIHYFSGKAKVLKSDENNNIEVLYGIVENVTEKILRRKEIDEYITIIDKHVLTSTTNKKGYITDISTAYCEIAGYTKDELIGQKHSILKHPDIPRKIYRDMWRTVTSGKQWQGELKNIRKDGTDFWIKLVISPTFDENGNIKHYTTINEDITDKKIIENLSIKDTLTGVFNRRKLDDILEKEILYARRYHIDFSLIIMDVDHFKLINDKNGHLLGDKILIDIANILSNSTREVDFIGRWGGEEFLIICPNSTTQEGENVALKLKTIISNYDFGIKQNVTASFGVSNFKEGDEPDDILSRADKALYIAKNNGRNQVQTLN